MGWAGPISILWHLPDGARQRFGIECKVQRGSRVATIESGLSQVIRYADTCGADEMSLVIFGQTDKSWEEKIFTESRVIDGVSVKIFGM